MALAIDASSPATAVQSANTATVTTASFTPPLDSLLLELWSANSQSGVNPSTPTITDNRGTPLTYTLRNWKSRADGAPLPDGQAADWTAPVTSSVAQTNTVTNGAAAERQAALRVMVLTGQHASTPVGAAGEDESVSASTVAQSYTATANNSWGFIAVCDWDLTGAMTAGTGCTLIASANVGTSFTYGFVRRTTADGVSGNSTTLNVNLGGTSTSVTWVYVEIVPAAGGTNATATPATVAVTTSAPRPNVNVSAGPAAVASTTALARPDVNVVAAPAALPTVVALPQPGAAVTVPPASISTSASMPPTHPNIAAGPAAVPAVVALAGPNVNVTVGSTVIPLTVALAQPGVNVTVEATVVPTVVSLPQAGVNTTVGATVIPFVVSLPQATPLAGGNATATPATVAATVTLARPDVNISAGPTTVAAVVTLPATAPNIAAGPQTIPVVVDLPQVTVDAGGGNVIATPATIAALVSVPAAALNITAGPSTIQVSVSVPVPATGQTVKGVSSAAVAAATASVAAVTALRTSAAPVTERRTSSATVG